MISAGAKKDLLVLQFALALLRVSSDESVFNDEDIIVRDDKTNYRLNKRIERGVEKLITKLQETLETLIAANGYDLAKWLRTNLNAKIAPTLKELTSKIINLEMLGLWILFVNFSERKKKLINEFKEYEDADQYLHIIELMGGTAAARLEGELFDEAYKIVSRLKS